MESSNDFFKSVLVNFGRVFAHEASQLDSAAMRNAVFEFLLFGLKEARACIFAGSFFGVLILSKTLPLGSLPRYDFILLVALVLQITGHDQSLNAVAR